MTNKLPSIVIVGRPNVGKSTLFNRLTGTRRSIVTDEPGITRDRIYGKGTWYGRTFEVVDTGGLVPEDKAAMPREILRQADVAIADATVLLLVVDVRAGVTPLDAELARRLRRFGKPLVIAANKVDTHNSQALAAPFYELASDVYPISAEHARGVDDLLEAITKDFPRDKKSADEEQEPLAESSAEEQPEPQIEPREIQVAIIGRPNVGKSTLLNRLAGVERSIVSAEPGTTRDAVDTLVQHNGKNYRFVDTAGIRRKGKTTQAAEKLSVVMARRHLEQADVALMICDASTGISAGDATIAGYASESGRSVIIVMNKWDQAIEKAKQAAQAYTKELDEGGGRRTLRRDQKAHAFTDPANLAEEYEKLVRERLKFLSYSPVIFISALTGERVEKLYALIDKVAQARRRRISTGELNRWLAGVDLDRGTSPSSRRVKIFYLTQASTAPPTFIVFTNQREKLHFGYERFLENRLREEFDFTGTPIRFIQRVRERTNREIERRPKKRPRAH